MAAHVPGSHARFHIVAEGERGRPSAYCPMQLKHDNKVSVGRQLHRREANSWSLTLGVGTVALSIIAAVFVTAVWVL